MTSTTNIHFERAGTPTDVVNISYYVVEYPERVSAQRGNVVMSAVPHHKKLDFNIQSPKSGISLCIYNGSEKKEDYYNALGKEVASIVDGYMQAGEHSEGFAASRSSPFAWPSPPVPF